MSFNELLESIKDAEPDRKHDYPYTSAVFSGGGSRGIAYCGAIQELHKRGYMVGIKNFAGSSAGSIIAGALACGASFNFLIKELSEVNLASFLDYGNRIKAVWNLYYHKGASPGDAFRNWYATVIEKLTGDREITLGQVHDKYGGRLVITGTSLNTREPVYFDHVTHPDMPLVTAVRISMSIPGLFIPVEYRGDVYVDGGVLDNYPANVFGERTLGLTLHTKSRGEYPPVSGFSSFVESLYGCYMKNARECVRPVIADTVCIICDDISSFDFHITDTQRDALVNAGVNAVVERFKK